MKYKELKTILLVIAFALVSAVPFLNNAEAAITQPVGGVRAKKACYVSANTFGDAYKVEAYIPININNLGLKVGSNYSFKFRVQYRLSDATKGFKFRVLASDLNKFTGKVSVFEPGNNASTSQSVSNTYSGALASFTTATTFNATDRFVFEYNGYVKINDLSKLGIMLGNSSGNNFGETVNMQSACIYLSDDLELK